MRYNKGLYNTFKYGASETPAPGYLWGIQIDWDQDGVFEGTNEAPYCTALNMRRGRPEFLDTEGHGFRPTEVGTLTMTLDNSSGRYDPYNTSGPYYPNIRPGARIQVSGDTGVGGTRFWFFTGRVKDIRPNGGRDKTVTITAEDGVRFLKDVRVTTLMQSIAIDDAMATILTLAGWPADWGYSLDPSPDFLDYWWVDPNTSAWDALQELADLACGTIYVDVQGQFIFFDNRHNYRASGAFLFDSTYFLKDIRLQQPWDSVRNRIDVITYPIHLRAQSTLWSLNDAIPIEPGATETFFVDYTYQNASCVAVGVTTPRSGVDWLVNTTPDGTGTNLTASCPMTFTSYARTAEISITNPTASVGYLWRMNVLGYSLDPSNLQTRRNDDLASQLLYGTKWFSLDTPLQQHLEYAKMILPELVAFFNGPLLLVEAQIEAQRLPQESLDLYTFAQLTIPALGLNHVVAVGSIEHEWVEATGQYWRTLIQFEPALQDSSTMWQFTTNVGTTSYFAG